MLKHSLLSLALLAGVAAAPAFAAPVEYSIDPTHTQVEFTYSHLGFSNITARFDNVEGTIVYDPANPSASSANVTVHIDSISAGVVKLDEHLKKDDFFDASKFPKAEFKSTQVTAAGTDKLTLAGDLTIHGVTKPISFDVSINKIGEHPMRKAPAAGFDATATIKRSDFGVSNYVPNISDEVRIDITVEAFAKPAA